MNPSNSKSSDLAARVDRERSSHEEDDVLQRSVELKQRFAHTSQTPAILAMEQRWTEFQGSVAGADVLDYGCGNGEQAVALAQAGGTVTGIDISPTYVETARAAARAAGVADRTTFSVMDAHSLDLPTDSMDWVFGRGILHHLELEVALAEIVRVLRPGGRAVFIEPLAGNPFLRVFRRLTPNARTEDEAPLSRRNLRWLRTFGDLQGSDYYGLLTAPVAAATSILMPRRPDNILIRGAFRVESLMRSADRALGPMHQYVLLVFEPSKSGRSDSVE